jgi:hypothetical protein
MMCERCESRVFARFEVAPSVRTAGRTAFRCAELEDDVGGPI